MPFDSKQKLQLYRKLETDMSGGVLLALDIFNEELGKMVEEKKAEMEKVLADMDKEIKARELKDGKTPTKQELIELMTPALSRSADIVLRDAGNKLKAVQTEMIASVRHGKDGITPKVGKDFPSHSQMKSFVESIRPKDGATPTEKYLIELIKKSAPKPEPIDMASEVFKLVQTVVAHPDFKIGAEKISNLPKISNKAYKHGGGDTVLAGANITVITNTNGTKTISALGGGFSTLAATETPNGSRTIFTFSTATAQPSYIVSDGVFMKSVAASGTINWTWNAGSKQATMAVPPTDDNYAIV